MLLDRQQILALIPHQGKMCLHDAVVDWNAEWIRLRSETHLDVCHPLRYGEQLRAIHLCEYGAQAMAVHGGLLAQQLGQIAAPGFLVLLRQVQLYCTRIDHLDGALYTEAERLLASANSWQYGFRVHHAERLLASGRAAVMTRNYASKPDNDDHSSASKNRTST